MGESQSLTSQDAQRYDGIHDPQGEQREFIRAWLRALGKTWTEVTTA